MAAGAPDDEVLIFQNIDFVMPSPHPRRTPPEVGGQLAAARQAVLRLDDAWNGDERKKTTVYSFHPGEQLRVRRRLGTITRYERSIDMDRGELSAFVETTAGSWSQRHFVSEGANVVISEYAAAPGKSDLNLCLSLDLPEEMEGYGFWMHGIAPETQMQYRLVASADGRAVGLLAHYPAFKGSELAQSGYMVVSQLIQTGGTRALHWEPVKTTHMASDLGRPVIEVRGAEKLHIVTRAVLLGDLGPMETFVDARYPARAVMDRALEGIDAEIRSCLQPGVDTLDYESAIHAHAQLHRARQYGQALELEADPDESGLSLEQLLERQKSRAFLSGELASRVYRLGRYAMLSCAGYTAPRLYGMWTGEWNPAWSAAYTMDANVNIQVSGMNVGSLPESALGYCRFVLRQLKDWEDNARQVYGMKEALLTPVNTDGRRAMMVEYDGDYPFQYWNAGATWMASPVFECWQCFEDQPLDPSLDLVEDLLRPLLRKSLNFWGQLCYPSYYLGRDGKPAWDPDKRTLEPGEHYLLIPTYSPENHPSGRNQSLTMNATMDISAARDCIRMVRALEGRRPITVSGKADGVMGWDSAKVLALCEDLERGLPPYLLDETGALKEWACALYAENNAHRHLSHLYCAWPGFETSGDRELARAALKAVENRDRENAGKDDTPSHGWIHKMLILARLRQGEALAAMLRKLFASDVFYSTGMTDHNTDRCRAVFCTDTLFGLMGVVQEMLVYSDDAHIEVLPALIPEWRKGSVRGLRTRCGVAIERLFWDMEAGEVSLTLKAARDTCVHVDYKDGWEKICGEDEDAGMERESAVGDRLPGGESCQIVWKRKS